MSRRTGSRDGNKSGPAPATKVRTQNELDREALDRGDCLTLEELLAWEHRYPNGLGQSAGTGLRTTFTVDDSPPGTVTSTGAHAPIFD
jgi:hypothetical protein